jgi:hypothetical protein
MKHLPDFHPLRSWKPGRILEPLPKDIQNYIDEFYNPYKDIFTKDVIQSNEIWRHAWLMSRKIQANPIPNPEDVAHNMHEDEDNAARMYDSDPVGAFVLDYLLSEWGVYNDEIDRIYQRTAYTPSNIFLYKLPMNDWIRVTVYHESEMIFKGGVYDKQQYSKNCLEEGPFHDYPTVHWDKNRWLVIPH